ncbi:MAG: hypothetical protein ABIN61_02845 [candidate division WOR-3 bacterium]
MKEEGRWLSFKEIFKDKKFHLVVLFIILLWVILLQIVYASGNKEFVLTSSDGYVTLIHARTWYEGHPLRIYPEDPPTPISPIPYAMLLSIGYWLGFKTNNSFIFWTYLINLIMLIFSALFLYRFFNRFFPEVAFPSTLLSTLFAPIFYNFFSCTTMPLIFLTISGGLAFLESFPFFITFAILSGFSRNEGILYYLFLSSIHLGINRKNFWKIALGFLPLLSPFFINKILIGQRVTQGTVSQILFHYDSFDNVIIIATENFLNHLKSTILGFYKIGEDFGLYNQAYVVFSLPPLFFFFTLIGFLEGNKKIAIKTALFLLILLLGDSFTLFTGMGCHRHILPSFPIIFAFSFLGFMKMNKLLKGSYFIIVSFFSLFFISQEIILLSYIRNNVIKAKREKEVAQYLQKILPEKTEIFDGTSGSTSTIFEAKKLKFITLTPNFDPILGKYISSFYEYTEISELVQRYYSNVKYLLTQENFEDNPLTKWLKRFSVKKERTFFWVEEDEIYNLYYIELSPLKKQLFEKDVIDELDIGDPSSEKLHNYKRVNFGPTKYFQILFNIESFYDAGRITEGYETFTLRQSKNKDLELICLIGRTFKGEKPILGKTLFFQPIKIDLSDSYFEIFYKGRKIYTKKIEKDYELINIPLLNEAEEDPITLKVEGRFISYHYWIKRKNL